MHNHTHAGEPRGLPCLEAYVRGDTSEPVIMSCMRPFGRDEVHRLLDVNRDQLSAVDPARSVILDSLLR